jgi:hypothetical protein
MECRRFPDAGPDRLTAYSGAVEHHRVDLPLHDPREFAQMPECRLNLGGVGRFDAARGEVVRAAHDRSHLGQSAQRGIRPFGKVDLLRSVEQPLDEAVEFLPPDEGQPRQLATEGSTGTLTRRKGSLRFWWIVSAFHSPLIRASMSRLRSSIDSTSGNAPPQSSLTTFSGEADSLGVAILPRNRVRTSW